jgi:hypothetical protein
MRTIATSAWSGGNFNDLEGFQDHQQNFRWPAHARPAMESALRFAHRKRLTSGNAFNPVGSTRRMPMCHL